VVSANPLGKKISDLRLSSGCRIGGSSFKGPEDFGVQSGMCLPLGANRNAIRTGGLFLSEFAANDGCGIMLSSNGKAIAVPSPRSAVRLEIRRLINDST